MPTVQARFWLHTIPVHEFVPYLPEGVCHLAGQMEEGEGGFRHWQLVSSFARKVTLAQVRRIFGPFHVEPTRSDAARAYVFKEDTRVAGTQFELGVLPFRRNASTDWNAVREAAKSGAMDEIPADVFVRCYNQLRRIGSDYIQPAAVVRTCAVFWGPTATGKSRRAWEEAGLAAYSKDPRTKWWDGYLGQKHVVIDEFRGMLVIYVGTIDIAHLLRWLDRYPVRVENKGSSLPLLAEHFWITSNLDPRLWYPDIDAETLAALMRRIVVTHFDQIN